MYLRVCLLRPAPAMLHTAGGIACAPPLGNGRTLCEATRGVTDACPTQSSSWSTFPQTLQVSTPVHGLL